MHAAFGTVLWVVCIAAGIVALVALATSGRTWDELGKHRLLMDRDAPPSSTASDPRERDQEIRQLLEARNARRARRGERPLDIDAELARLTAPATVDPELRDEIRQLVMARNFRRIRAGKPPLDVESEIERQIAELGEP
jgi:hypothetical protein